MRDRGAVPTIVAPRPWLGILAVLGSLAAGACSDAMVPQDGMVADVDLDALFAPPSVGELEAVASDWAARDPAAVDVDVVHDTTVTVDVLTLRVRIVSHSVEGVLHYGAIVVNDGLDVPTPTLVYAHGGDRGVAVDDVLSIMPFLGDVASSYVWVIPSFRSEPLEMGSMGWTSNGPASPWDRDVDDALALLEVTFELEPLADSSRVGVLGFSRGAGVGLLMAIRDPGIDRVVEFFGPTDFFGPFVQDVVEEALMGSARDLPGLAFLDEEYLQPLARGEISLAEVRSQLVRRSAVLFADRLPTVQIHHGTADEVVDVSQAQALIEALTALGREEPELEWYLYEGGSHNLLSLANSIGRAVDFLEALR